MQKAYMEKILLLRMLLVLALFLPYIHCWKVGKYYKFQSLSQSRKAATTKNVGLLSIRNQTMSTLSDFPSVNVDENKNSKSASTARNKKSHDNILGSELSPKDKKIGDIETEIEDLKAKVLKLEIKREEVKIAIKDIESDIRECTSETDQQELFAKLPTKKTYLNLISQEIVAKKTRINYLAVQGE